MNTTNERTSLLHPVIGSNEESSTRSAIGHDDSVDHVSQFHTFHSDTKRLLTSTHISMISIGGIIGTGLFIGVRNTLVNGPLFSMLSYLYVSLLCYIVIQTVGEMSCYLPMNGSICQFQFYLLSDSIGLAVNLIYWLSWSMTLALELSLINSIICWWHDFDSPVTITFVFWLLFVVFNLLPVNNYGDVESAITIVKVVFIISWIFISIGYIFSSHTGFKNWLPANSTSPSFYNIVASLISSCFTFQSIESIALCSGEIKLPQKNIPQAIRYVMVRILVFYITTLFLLTIMVSSKDLGFNDDDSDIFQSPFLIGLVNCGMSSSSTVLNIFNLVILISIMSAANSNIYFGSRCLVSIAEAGHLPQTILRTRNGVPYVAILLTSVLGLLSLLLKYRSVEILFNLLIKICSTAGLLMWLCLITSYIRFRKYLQYNGIKYTSLPYQSSRPGVILALAYFAAINIFVIISMNGGPNLVEFLWDDLVSSYLTVVVFIFLVVGLKWHWNQPFFVPLDKIVMPVYNAGN